MKTMLLLLQGLNIITGIQKSIRPWIILVKPLFGISLLTANNKS
jgi:hypothetical protein